MFQEDQSHFLDSGFVVVVVGCWYIVVVVVVGCWLLVYCCCRRHHFCRFCAFVVIKERQK